MNEKRYQRGQRVFHGMRQQWGIFEYDAGLSDAFVTFETEPESIRISKWLLCEKDDSGQTYEEAASKSS